MASPKEERPVAALLAPDILALLDESPGNVAAETEELHPANLADVAEALPRDRLAQLLRALPPARAADVLEYLDEELRSELLEELSARQAAELVSQMTPDDRADALEDLEETRADEILSEIAADARGETERLLAYEPDYRSPNRSAGRARPHRSRRRRAAKRCLCRGSPSHSAGSLGRLRAPLGRRRPRSSLLRWVRLMATPSILRKTTSKASRNAIDSSSLAWLPMRSWLTMMGRRRGTPISILML